MKWINSILNGLDVNFSIKNMEKYIVYLFWGVVVYLALPSNLLNNIYQKLTNNRTINIIIIIILLSLGFYYIQRLLNIVIKQIKINKSARKERAKRQFAI